MGAQNGVQALPCLVAMENSHKHLMHMILNPFIALNAFVPALMPVS